jgi:hypothetical protein
VVVLLVLLDMIFRRMSLVAAIHPDSWNVALLVHVLGAMAGTISHPESIRSHGSTSGTSSPTPVG